MYSLKSIISFWYWISVVLIEIFILLVNGVFVLIIIKFLRFYYLINWFIFLLVVFDLFFGVVVILFLMMCRVWLFCNNVVLWVFFDFVVYVLIVNVCVMSFDWLVVVEFLLRY